MVDDHSVVPEALHAAISVNEAWVDSLYRDQSRRLVGLAAAITLDPGVAEEIVHDAFVGLQRRGADIANPIGYLRRSVVNLSVSRLRRRRVASRRAHITVWVFVSSSPPDWPYRPPPLRVTYTLADGTAFAVLPRTVRRLDWRGLDEPVLLIGAPPPGKGPSRISERPPASLIGVFLPPPRVPSRSCHRFG